MIGKQHRWWLFFLTITWIFLFFLQKTNLAASDLGRHIKNGEVIVSTGEVFSSNLYSYTNPDFYAPNHHWLFGVISYSVHAVSGFSGLTILGAILYTAAIGISWWQSFKKTGFYPSLIALIVATPIVAHRSETRPEAFSLFFFALLWYWMSNWSEITSKNTWLAYGVPLLLMVLWINIHIFFILAIPIFGAAFLHNVLERNLPENKSVVVLSVGALLTSFINPFGVTLLLYPFQIFLNYGYRVAENQPLWFFLQHFTETYHWYLLSFMLVSLGGLIFLWQQKKHYSWYSSILFIFFAGFTARLIRMENVFAIVSIPILAETTSLAWKKWHVVIQRFVQSSLGIMSISLGGFIVLAILFGTGLFMPFKAGFGVGLYPGYDQSIAFVKQLPIKGAIFNNFDSGSFLIYSLYPDQKVFIDNRAEAYPDKFLKDSYIAAQENEDVWTSLEKQYNFQAIIFYRHERTNWGQEFMVKRLQDSSWVPMYVDSFLIIFLKDTEENKALIEQYRLPKEMFSVR